MERDPCQAPKRRPIVAITMGDVAGIGPELIVRAWSEPRLHAQCQPIVIGAAGVLRRYAWPRLSVSTVSWDEEFPDDPSAIPCLEPAGMVSHALADLTPGCVHAAAGKAAVDFLDRAVDLAVARRVDAIVTMPVNKAGLHAAGIAQPGHTEILADRLNVRDYAMMLYRKGLAVVHTTLHVPLRDVPGMITTEAVMRKISLVYQIMPRLGCPRPRIGIAALNPHASDDGVFGDEEKRIIQPAVESMREQGVDCTGPLPADTLFVRANAGEFDAVVAMYHDQGHIALKLLGWREAVNITVGLPIVRTSVAHGTAYDIVGRGRADPSSLFEAVDVAAQLCRSGRG